MATQHGHPPSELERLLLACQSYTDRVAAEIRDPSTPEDRKMVLAVRLNEMRDALIKLEHQHRPHRS